MDSNRRSVSPDRRGASSSSRTRPKELSFYKKSSTSASGGRQDSGAVGSFSSRRDPLDKLDDRRRAGAAPAMTTNEDVPGRYGGSRGAPHPGRSSGYDDRRGGERSGGGDRDRGGGSSRSDRPYDDRRDRDRDRDSGRPREPYRHPDRQSTLPGQSYNGGEPLRRVDTRDERDSSSSYRGGGDLRRVETRDEPAPAAGAAKSAVTAVPVSYGTMIEVIANDRLGRKVRVKCLPTDTIGDLKKLIAAQTGTIASKIQLKKWYTTYKDHIELRDYEITNGMSLEMY